ncbi:MAG: hypothetical protein LBT05_13120 [Planctomycetaceae bacterium]|nr:hypothetical protein [Planctomycetaceae bacterium]
MSSFYKLSFIVLTSWGLALLSFSANAQQHSPTKDKESIRLALLAERKNDARLNDVYFITPKIGWAVGDCGVIWNTRNGGEDWTIQESGASYSLFGVDFIDSQNGFVVGGMTEPYSHRGIGVVLKTTDGGQNWERADSATFPILYCVRIESPGKLWVAGASSEQCLTGILRSSDNGKTWQKQSGVQTVGWSSLKFLDAKTAVGIGLDGTIRLFPNNEKPLSATSLGLRRVNAVDVFSPSNAIQNKTPDFAWTVGDGGAMICSRNGGKTWDATPASLLPLERSDLFDFQTVFARENNIWIAGNPGAKIFFSHDGGVHWRQAFTGVSVPIRKIRFISPQHGFAVGELGTILATSDGGYSWKIQRDGGKRLAVLGIFGRVQDVPYEALAQLCLEDGFLGGVEILFRQDSMTQDASSSNNEIPVMRRVHEAATQCGVAYSSQAWAFPLDLDELTADAERGISQVVRRIEQENDKSSGLSRFRERLTATIRALKPNIIIAAGNAPVSENDAENPAILSDPVRNLLQREILGAVYAAADPNMYPEQLNEIGLQIWQTDKVHLCYNETILQRQVSRQETFRKAAAREGNVQIDMRAIGARYGKTAEEIALNARMLTESEPPTTAPTTLSFRTAFDIAAVRQNKNPAELNGGSLTNGISLTAGGEARRKKSDLSMIPYFETLQQQKMHQENARNLIAGLGKVSLTDGNRVVSQAEELTRLLDQETAAQTLFEMGNRLVQVGNYEAAAEIFQRIAQRYPRHFLAGEASRRLLKYLCDVPINETLNNAANDFPARNPSAQAMQITALMNRQSPDFAADPHLRFCLAAAQRDAGNLAAAEMFYTARSMPVYRDAWAIRAASELTALRFQTQTLKTLDAEQSVGAALKTALKNGGKRNLSTISCYPAKERPFLDGKFDDSVWTNHPATPFTEIWRSAREISENFHAVRQETPAGVNDLNASVLSPPQRSEICFAYDDEFFYLAVRCRKSRDFTYRFTETPRPYDPNLSRQDRVEILLDKKRNFTTFDVLELDHRGWVRESRRQEQTWNPQWFIARNEDADFWLVEAAFPFRQLADRPPFRGEIWGVAFRRLIPGVGVETWNAENSFRTTEGLGYLAFE